MATAKVAPPKPMAKKNPHHLQMYWLHKIKKEKLLISVQTSLVLLQLVVNRLGNYDDNRRLGFTFKTEETWGGYYDF